MLVVLDPETEWAGNGSLRQRIAEWTRQRGNSQRLYPGAAIWCIKKSSRDLRTKTERWLAWKRVKSDMDQGTLGHDFDPAEIAEIEPEFKDAQSDAREEVWACYRYVLLADAQEPDGLRVIDLGAGHSGAGQTLTGRIVSALKSETLLNESVGAGYIERNWPPALKDSGAWPLASLRKSFLDGSLTRLIDPDTSLRAKIIEFVERGDFGLASGRQPDGDFTRVWFSEPISSDEITFDSDVYLLRKFKAAEIKMKGQRTKSEPEMPPADQPSLDPTVFPPPQPPITEAPVVTAPDQPAMKTVSLTGNIPSEIWNRLGTKIIPKLKSVGEMEIGLEFKATVTADKVANLQNELRQILDDLGMTGKIRIDVE
jgi:hypothetical protein